MIDDYADKTITKDTNITYLSHHCNTWLISTRWKTNWRKLLGMNTNNLALNISILAGERENIC
jgi:hypothetical protein